MKPSLQCSTFTLAFITLNGSTKAWEYVLNIEETLLYIPLFQMFHMCYLHYSHHSKPGNALFKCIQMKILLRGVTGSTNGFLQKSIFVLVHLKIQHLF
jgi:hypothetical protein